jgi:hypothetical protein
MNRITFFLLIFLLIAGVSFSGPIQSPSTPHGIVGSPAALISDANPQPVKVMSGAVSATVASLTVKPYSNASYTNITLTPNVAYSIPLMSGVDSMTITNSSDTGHFWMGLKTATVAISTGQKAFSSIELEHIDISPISIIASTALPISILQLGY